MTEFHFDRDVGEFIERCLSFFDEDSAHMDAREQRSRYRALCQSFDRPRPHGIQVTDDSVMNGEARIPVRIYRPENLTEPGGCLIYFHGGGWVVGDLDSHDSIACEIADRAKVVVIAVDYRLAPEFVYPTAHEDCWAALTKVTGSPNAYGINADRLLMGGDSAGAHIAAGLAVRARKRGGPSISGLVLIYGGFGGELSLPSYTECSNAPLLTTADMAAYHSFYWPDGLLDEDTLARPLTAASFAHLPPAFIQAAEIDPLRDDSVELARRMEAAGVEVELHVEKGLVHSFLRARHVTQRGAGAFDRLCLAVARLGKTNA